MSSDGPPGTEPLPSDLGSAIAALNGWSNPELQAKLAELGAPTMGKKIPENGSESPGSRARVAERS